MKYFVRIGIAVVIMITAAFLLFPEKVQEYPLPPSFSVPQASTVENKSVIYKEIQGKIKGNKQVVHMLEINMAHEGVSILPVLSHDSIFGFEKTSVMAQRVRAKAAVNGGFFHAYGQPSGFTVIDGKLICTPQKMTDRPVFLINGQGEAEIKDIDIRLSIRVAKQLLKIDGINREPLEDEIIVFTPAYGVTTRTNNQDTFNILTGAGAGMSHLLATSTEVSIPQEGMAITATGRKRQELEAAVNPFSDYKGKKVEMIYTTVPAVDNILQAFEGGFWVVKDGQKVIRKRENWVGLTTNREPRTIAGIKDNDAVVFMTIDGRQPGYSTGVTGRELAQYLLDYGIENALMLDGGASTTMVVNGQVVNRPSYRQRERMIGGAICVVEK